jgi:hypothetical protein
VVKQEGSLALSGSHLALQGSRTSIVDPVIGALTDFVAPSPAPLVWYETLSPRGAAFRISLPGAP